MAFEDEPSGPITMESGALLLEWEIDDDEDSLTVELKFDRPQTSSDVAELAMPGMPNNFILKALQRKHWAARDREGTILMAMDNKITWSEGNTKCELLFRKKDKKSPNNPLN